MTRIQLPISEIDQANAAIRDGAPYEVVVRGIRSTFNLPEGAEIMSMEIVVGGAR